MKLTNEELRSMTELLETILSLSNNVGAEFFKIFGFEKVIGEVRIINYYARLPKPTTEVSLPKNESDENSR